MQPNKDQLSNNELSSQLVEEILEKRKKRYPEEDSEEVKRLLLKIFTPKNEKQIPRKQLYDQAIDKIKARSPKEFKKNGPHYEKALSNMIKNNMLPKDALGFNDQYLEYLYGHAYRFFQSGKYPEAKELFLFLSMLDPRKSKYSFGIGCCYQRQEKWQDAINAYLASFNVNPIDPIPLYHISECMIKLNLIKAALLMLKKTLMLTENKPTYNLLKERATLMVENLNKQTQEETKAA